MLKKYLTDQSCVWQIKYIKTSFDFFSQLSIIIFTDFLSVCFYLTIRNFINDWSFNQLCFICGITNFKDSTSLDQTRRCSYVCIRFLKIFFLVCFLFCFYFFHVNNVWIFNKGFSSIFKFVFIGFVRCPSKYIA